MHRPKTSLISLPSKTSQFCRFLHWIAFDLVFSLRDSENNLLHFPKFHLWQGKV